MCSAQKLSDLIKKQARILLSQAKNFVPKQPCFDATISCENNSMGQALCVFWMGHTESMYQATFYQNVVVCSMTSHHDLSSNCKILKSLSQALSNSI